MIRLDDLCEETVRQVRGCLGCAVVDLETGLPLAMEVVSGSLLTEGAMETMAVASVDYFRSRTIWQLELEVSGGAGEAAESFVREIQTTTADTCHFMSVVPEWENTLLILITDKTANLGMGWVSMRQTLDRIRTMHEQELQEPDLQEEAPGWPHQPALQSPGAAASQPLQPGGAAGGGDSRSRAAPANPPPHQGPSNAEVAAEPSRQAPIRTSDLPNPQWRGGRGRGVRRGTGPISSV